ncbi:asparagine synthase protein [Halorhabdus tiamatea SARL4B]|uniref:Asparagine synthase protein n=1 Tax=Halorhabdus tiamatea SARL4B TaxID=1033806 RepID=F7PJ34_9EURY|nr:sugar transferase [Halorhabdus tiamatea]ERJ06862.1 asparagine synthase protein [Halorhabdus tiamatea SARL4B]CCQ32999.1 exopolysaccharide biosynthesis polyprenyl glycosylphosphotransferase [Halorhabdus tiamatea SARL4B]
MKGHWRYRGASVLGTAVLSFLAVVVVNGPLVRTLLDAVPVIQTLATAPATGSELLFEASTTTAVILAAMVPLYKPRPRRILDTWMAAARRTTLAFLSLATIGYFDYTYRLPRATLLVSGGLLLVVLPLWFVAIRRRPARTGERTIIIGDDPETIRDILAAVDGAVIGYVSPPTAYATGDQPTTVRPRETDGGTVTDEIGELSYLGGLSRLGEVLVDYDVDTAVLAFDRPDRAEFFGALDTCYEHGVAAKVHRDHADVVLTDGTAGGELVDVDLEPWDWQDHLVKRVFDLAFAAIGLAVLSPAIAVIAVAIKLEDSGPIFYSQDRTATFGDTFTIYKFRSMVPNAEKQSGVKLSEEDKGERDPRVTRLGRVLRQTHLDEVPQLWSILVGDMSVVGPRPERPKLDDDIENSVSEWRRRWFVKPGLTGLAQINDLTGHEPGQKFRYDMAYIRKQSFWFDIQIVIRQIWKVLSDVSETATGSNDPSEK